MKSFLLKLKPARIKKAIGAAIGAGFAYWLKAKTGGLSPEELGQIASAAVGTGVVVYFTPQNAPG